MLLQPLCVTAAPEKTGITCRVWEQNVASVYGTRAQSTVKRLVLTDELMVSNTFVRRESKLMHLG